ncbi:MAG: cobalamin-dependent protein [Phycisphaerales bacterium]|nr:cobalamin-dependent protein [Phycisphaerales bacterium]
MSEPLLLRYMQPLLAGRRADCFGLIRSAVSRGQDARKLISDVVWPAMTQIDRLYRDDVINCVVRNMAARINRAVADQLQPHLPPATPIGKRVLITCAESENEEAGAQMIADLLESTGWEVYFVGGGVPHDEIIAAVGQLRPDVLLIFGTTPQDVPASRRLVEWLREVNTCPTMNIVVSGGVFNRADGLWREVGADAFCEDSDDVLETLAMLTPRTPGIKRTGGVKKRHRKRQGTAETAAAEPTPSQGAAIPALAAARAD